MDEARELVTLADGTILEAGAAYDGQVSVWIWETEPGTKTPAEYLAIFLDPAKTVRITWQLGSSTAEWTGFTRFAAIQIDGSGITRIRMMRPMENATEAE